MFNYNINNITFNFNKNRYIALVIMIISGMLGWYSTILLTNEYEEKLPTPDENQLFALVFGILLSFLYWFKQCYNIRIR
tara:strand:+ start:1515 stop:1751 length:237 start_codon:yes stop_codon:yes gene_type:complete